MVPLDSQYFSDQDLRILGILINKYQNETIKSLEVCDPKVRTRRHQFVGDLEKLKLKVTKTIVVSK